MTELASIIEAFKAGELAAERFYRRRAALSRNLETRSILAGIADDEAGHLALAGRLATDGAGLAAPKSPSNPFSGLLGAYTQRCEALEQRLMSLGTERDLYDLALEHEKDCVLLYGTLASRLSPGVLKDQLEKVRAQEALHFDKLWGLRSSWVSWSRLSGPSDAALEAAVQDLSARMKKARPRRPRAAAAMRRSQVAT